jgi:hypothetical protein
MTSTKYDLFKRVKQVCRNTVLIIKYRIYAIGEQVGGMFLVYSVLSQSHR